MLGAHVPLFGKGTISRGQSTQGEINERESTRNGVKDTGSGSASGDHIWSGDLVVWTEGMVRGLLKTGKQTGNGDHRHAPVRPDGSSSAGGKTPASDHTAK